MGILKDAKKFRTIIKFVKKYRDIHISEFQVLTNADTFIIIVDKDGEHEQTRINY